MPTIKLPTQNGNSCAAHCTAIAVGEIIGVVPSQTLVEAKLWPAIQFVDKGGASSTLHKQKNSDPRLIVELIKRKWPKVNAQLMCDQVQKKAAIPFVAQGMQKSLDALFEMLANDARNFPVLLDECVFYNCSYTMHNAGAPHESNFTGLHNILVTYQGGKVLYYNSNESLPVWKETSVWKKLEKQNGGSHSYVFTGVAVAIF